MGLEDLTIADFEPHVGARFAIAALNVELVLESATTLGSRPGGRDPFSLVFRGPVEPLLRQATHALAHPRLGVLDVFVVPIARDADGASYEAIFA